MKYRDNLEAGRNFFRDNLRIKEAFDKLDLIKIISFSENEKKVRRKFKKIEKHATYWENIWTIYLTIISWPFC